MNASDEWELSKENIQPLKHGRKVASLTAALQPHNVDQHQQLILQRQSMEAALRSYMGDDPLDPWDQYIKWIEQAYPSGGKESNLQVLLEKCVAAFKNEQRYMNDIRYVSCWIKLANSFLNNPLEVFQFMRDQSIGTGLSVFYEAWSWELEQHGNTKKADTVYREGLSCNAVPRNALETAHRDFQSRVARTTMNEMQEGIDAPSMPGEQRDHLGDLRAKGRLQKVSSQRIGSAKQASRGGLGTAMPTPQVGQSFSVFCDDENSRGGASGGHSSLPPPTGEWEHIPIRQEAQKENLKGAGPWAGQRVRQSRSAGIGVSEVATFARPSFTVHVDESVPDIVTPRKMPEIGSQVLSARKPEKPSNLLENIARQPIADDKTRAMYCKHLIYSGAQEMSLEELRAIRYNAKKEANKIEEQRLALQRQKDEYSALMRQKQEALERQMEQQRMLHEQQLVEQRKAQEQLKLQLHQQMQQQQQQMQQQLQQMQQELKHQPTKQPLLVHQEAVPRQHGALSQSVVQDTKPDIGPRAAAVTRQLNDRDPTVTRQLIYEDTGNQASWVGVNDSSNTCNPTPAATYHPTPSSRTALNSTAPITPSAPASDLSQNRTPGKHNNPTPGSCHSRNSSYLNLSRVTPSRTPGGLTRPSPTVNTKEAMGLVMAMLNNPLGEDDDFLLESGRFLPPAQRDNDFEDIFTNTASKKPEPQSVPTFDRASESSSFTAVGKAASAGPSFTIFNETAAESNGRELIDEGELEHLDDQENMPPQDYIKPKPDGRQRAGILQPAHGIPFMSLEDQEREAWEQDRKSPEETDAMEGVELLKVLGEEEHPPDVTILSHQDAQSAFKVASRMASTPFTSSGVLSFSPLSSIKPSLGQGASSLEHDSLVDRGLGDDGGRSVILASRVYAGTQESFEECTVNTSNQIKLSPIMELSNEDARSSGSSHSSSTGLSSTHPTFSSSQEGLSSTKPGYSSTHHEGLSATNPGHPGTHVGLSATYLGVSSTHKGHSVTQSNPHSASASFSTSTACKGLASNTNENFYRAPGSSADAQIKDECNVSIQHQSQMAYSFSNNSIRHGTSAVEPNMGSKSEDQSMDLKSVRNGLGENRSLMDSQKAQPFQIFDDSTNLKLSETSASKSFQIFEDPSQKQGQGSGDLLHQSAQGIPSRQNISNQQSTSQMSQSHTALDESVFREYSGSFATRPRKNAFETSALERQCGSSIGKPTNPHQSFQVFNDTTAPSLEQSFQSTKFKPPSEVSHHEQQSLHESLMEVHPSEASIHLSTSLMSKMHLAATEESMMEMSQHDASLMECSEVPDDRAAAAGATDAFIDPFSDEVKDHLLQSLPVPLIDYDGYTESDCEMPDVVPAEAVGLNTELYNVEKCIGEGAFAKIYQASILSLYTDDHSNLNHDEDDKVVLKVQKQPCPWEFYISRTLHQRLSEMRNPVDVRASLMYANGMHVFPDGSCLVTKKHKNLTLLDAINEYNKTKTVMPEPLLLLFTIEILHVVEQMHACNIIHGDIKPDNYLLLLADEDETESHPGNVTMTSTKHIKLIDFGRSIDMRLFPQGTTFTATCNTDGFMCTEMQYGRPWTYQTDLFGIAATVHCLMFGSYMKVYGESGRCKHTSSIKRFYSPCWKNFFDTLLNVSSCDALPSLGELRRDLEGALLATRSNLELQKMKLFAMLF